MRARRTMIALGLLAACGPLADEGPLTGLASVVTGGGEEAAAVDPRQTLTREMIEQLPNDLLLVDVPSRDATATLVRAGENGARATWISPDGISVTVEGGLIVATRGFGHDLMAADVTGLRALLRGAGSGRYVAETLDGTDQVVRTVYDCAVDSRTPETITIFERGYATTRVQVSCTGPDLRFRNTYWVDGSGVVWKSQQFVTQELGYLGLERL